MTVALKKNVPGFRDANGVFRPIRSASYVGGGSSRRRATTKDRRKYSKAKAGDLGKARQERALEDVFDREIRLEREAKAAEKRERDRIERELEREIYGETSGRTSRGKGQTLAQFIRSEGGINTKKKVRKGRTRYGDSLENFTRKGSGSTGLVTTVPGKGKSLDYMHQAAREAGYDVASMDDLLDALDNELRSGKKTYSTHGSMTYNPQKTPKFKIGDKVYSYWNKTSAAPIGQMRYQEFDDPKSCTWNYALNHPTLGRRWVDEKSLRKTKLRPAGKKKNPIRVLKHKFYVGQKLATRSIGNHDVIYRGTVVSRTPKFVTVKIDGDRELKRCGVKLYDGTEYIFPFGRYSMAPTFRAEKGDRVGNPKAKKNPDLLSMFANAAVGIASTLQIHEMTKSRKRPAAPKKRGTTKAKRRNPARSTSRTLQKPARSKGVSRTRTAKNPSQPNLFKRQPKGELYVLTIGSGDDLISVYLHDGDKDGFSKRFKTLAGARSYAKRNKVKLVENPKRNGIIKRAWARSRAASEYRRELRLEAAAERSRRRRQKAEQAARSNPRRSASGKTTVARAASGKKAVARSARPYKFKQGDRVTATSGPHKGKTFTVHQGGHSLGKPVYTMTGLVTTRGVKSAWQFPERGLKFAASAKKPRPAASRKNPKSTARRRTFEMFQGRKVTTARPMMVSNHAPANLDALGDLIELKIAGGPTLKFNGKGTKLCAANGKLWIAGKRFAKPNPAAKANELNPIGEIDHVVYGTYKPHHGDHNYTHYIHKLGEESGRRPILCVDREGFPVIRGGNYKIEARGIVD